MNMWFCWELSDAGEYEPVVYRTNFGQPELDERIRSNLVAVPADCIGEFNEPMFGRLRDRFPMVEVAV